MLLDTSLSSSICQPSSVCRYRARGLSLFRGDKVKIVIELVDLSSSVTYRARWVIELGFSREEKREKIEIKAIITTWRAKSETPSRSQFVTDKKHCFAGRLMSFWYFKKNIDKKTSFIYLMRDYLPPTARELNDLVLKRRLLTSLFFSCKNRIHLKKFKG